MTRSNVLSVLFTFLVFAFVSTSCTKEETVEMTEEEAVEIIETSLQKNSGGMVESIEAYTEKIVTDTVNTLCAILYQDNFNFDFDSGAVVAAYTVDWSYEFACNNLNLPISAQFDLVAQGTYQSNRMNSADNMSGNLEVTGLALSSTDLVFDGNYSRAGTQDITTNFNSRSLNSTVSIAINSINISKSSYQIVSGSAEVVLTGNDQNNNFSYSGMVVFNGGGSATLTMNGNSYTINLYQ
jgi:uncharacterized protein YpmS